MEAGLGVELLQPVYPAVGDCQGIVIAAAAAAEEHDVDLLRERFTNAVGAPVDVQVPQIAEHTVWEIQKVVISDIGQGNRPDMPVQGKKVIRYPWHALAQHAELGRGQWWAHAVVIRLVRVSRHDIPQRARCGGLDLGSPAGQPLLVQHRTPPHALVRPSLIIAAHPAPRSKAVPAGAHRGR
jgi:hypothetical protein